MPALYFVLGQAGWFACVLSAAKGFPWLGVTLVLVLIATHLFVVRQPAAELKLIACVMAAGAIWDSALVCFGLLSYPSGILIRNLAPDWIVALWALFAAQLNTTYDWLKRRIWLAALFGAVAGPLSFRAGAALGAVKFEKPWAATVALAMGWAGLLPLVIVLSRRCDGVRLRK